MNIIHCVTISIGWNAGTLLKLCYMNLLKGAPRAIAKDWIKETQIMLETLQAANVLHMLRHPV
ncbi:MICOS complex subunit Mic60-like [Nilaparvata lugens]|uniref:MICOS complex subunit Mic60-like n=1 Tax=Nilaparvata lugens TaxID=108931 RepID=UPI00193E9207|nr:MICOS complex subunit Mic60-like [Nilaparvata lugens]